MINMLKNKDISKLAKYDDLVMPNIEDFLEQECIVVDQKQMMDSLKEGVMRKGEQTKLIEDAVLKLGLVGIENEIAKETVQKLIENDSSKDLSSIVQEAFLTLSNLEEDIDQVNEKDLRRIIESGRDGGHTAYQALYDVGFIKQDYPVGDIS